ALDELGGAGLREFAAALAPDGGGVGWRPGQVCRNREQVLAAVRRALEAGKSGTPEVVAETEGGIVVDPHVDPPNEEAPELHFVFVVEDDRIVEMRDYPDRAAALRAVGL